MSNDVWIGALLSVPIGIGTGLVIPSLQRWYEGIGKSRSQSRHDRLVYEYGETLHYVSHPTKFTYFLIISVLRCVIATVAITMGQGVGMITMLALRLRTLGNTTADVSPTYRVGAMVYVAIGLLISTVGIAMITRTGRRAGAMYRRITTFDQYVETIPDDIRSVDVEIAAREAAGRGVLPLT